MKEHLEIHFFKERNQCVRRSQEEDEPADQRDPAKKRDDDRERSARPNIMGEDHCKTGEQHDRPEDKKQCTVVNGQGRGFDHSLPVQKDRQGKHKHGEPK